jgi:hypothetical protein
VERSEDRLSTRDIASPATGDEPRDDPRFDRDEAPPAETAAPEPTRDTMADPTLGSGGTTAGEPATTAEPAEPTAAAEPQAAPAAAEPAAATTTATDDAAPLLADSESFQTRWEEIQVRFVDEPRGAVEDADALVATVMQRLAESFAQERERLEAQWGRGEDISTEDLRVALQRYRSFFQRLLST